MEVVVAEAELEDARLLQLDGHVGQGDAGADHRPVLGGWKRELWDSLQESFLPKAKPTGFALFCICVCLSVTFSPQKAEL